MAEVEKRLSQPPRISQRSAASRRCRSGCKTFRSRGRKPQAAQAAQAAQTRPRRCREHRLAAAETSPPPASRRLYDGSAGLGLHAGRHQIAWH